MFSNLIRSMIMAVSLMTAPDGATVRPEDLITVMDYTVQHDNGRRFTIKIECVRNADCDNIPLLPADVAFLLPKGELITIRQDGYNVIPQQ